MQITCPMPDTLRIRRCGARPAVVARLLSDSYSGLRPFSGSGGTLVNKRPCRKPESYLPIFYRFLQESRFWIVRIYRRGTLHGCVGCARPQRLAAFKVNEDIDNADRANDTCGGDPAPPRRTGPDRRWRDRPSHPAITLRFQKLGSAAG